jgi:CRP-like cAMP-binding protein
LAATVTVTPRQVLASTAFFSDVLDAESLDRLAANLRVVSFPKGAVLIREDDVGSSMFVLAAGEADVTVPQGARKVPIAMLKTGDIFGEMSLLTGARRAATVTARSPIAAVEIPKSALSPLMEASPQLADRFAAILKKRQAELDRLYDGGWKLPGNLALAGLIRGYFGGGLIPALRKEPSKDSARRKKE